MALALSKLLSDTRIELRDPDGITFQDPDVIHAINIAYRSIFQKITMANQDYFALTEFLDLVAGQRNYALPDDFLSMKRCEFCYQNTTTPIFQYDRQATMNYTSYGPNGLYVPPFYFLYEGDDVCFEPTLQTNITDGIKLTYYPVCLELEDDVDEVNANFKDMWIDAITIPAALHCLSQIEMVGSLVSISEFQRRIDDAVETIMTTVRMRSFTPKIRRRRGYFR